MKTLEAHILEKLILSQKRKVYYESFDEYLESIGATKRKMYEYEIKKGIQEYNIPNSISEKFFKYYNDIAPKKSVLISQELTEKFKFKHILITKETDYIAFHIILYKTEHECNYDLCLGKYILLQKVTENLSKEQQDEYENILVQVIKYILSLYE